MRLSLWLWYPIKTSSPPIHSLDHPGVTCRSVGFRWTSFHNDQRFRRRVHSTTSNRVLWYQKHFAVLSSNTSLPIIAFWANQLRATLIVLNNKTQKIIKTLLYSKTRNRPRRIFQRRARRAAKVKRILKDWLERSGRYMIKIKRDIRERKWAKICRRIRSQMIWTYRRP